MGTKKAGRPPVDAARQLERAHRILDAAAGLVLRWGYDKTTIEDVARAAEVAKGTIYLHWRTRDELFVALLRRERVAMLRAVRQADPQTLDDLVRHLALGVMRDPLMRASVLNDSQVLGKLTRHKRADTELVSGFLGYFETLAGLGVIRGDLHPGEHATVLGSVLHGFLTVSARLPEEFRLPDERVAELVGESVHRTLESGSPFGPEAVEATRAFLALAIDVAESKLKEALG
ncbi:TetR/AcrR family transcriptional regulator [Nonomuraea soli]|uniref:AcrR family transcriptional regulator n=1 Tax=Nonomuraea soli TaxID=1032476 RepID=A0A7W0CDM6_9ACTN|nr:TetR/AcrR family transcriptional regulator [Nonomuraea soli]MBA2889242.1 AcrR family transcriptional regulator [Nonomuraea soli]